MGLCLLTPGLSSVHGDYSILVALLFFCRAQEGAWYSVVLVYGAKKWRNRDLGDTLGSVLGCFKNKF